VLWIDKGQDTVAHITQPCEKCTRTCDQSVRRSLYYLTFWSWRTAGWVRLFQISTRYHLECSRCGRRLGVKKPQVDDIHKRLAVASASQGGWYAGTPAPPPSSAAAPSEAPHPNVPLATHAYEPPDGDPWA
jgi:hypothetical protein